MQKSRFCGSAITSRDELLCGKNFAIEEICETKERQRFFRWNYLKLSGKEWEEAFSGSATRKPRVELGQHLQRVPNRWLTSGNYDFYENLKSWFCWKLEIMIFMEIRNYDFVENWKLWFWWKFILWFWWKFKLKMTSFIWFTWHTQKIYVLIWTSELDDHLEVSVGFCFCLESVCLCALEARALAEVNLL